MRFWPIYRHVELHAPNRTIGYVSSRIPKFLLKPGQGPTSTTARTDEVLREGVLGWVSKKLTKHKKTPLLESLFPSEWKSCLVHNNVKSTLELEYISDE